LHITEKELGLHFICYSLAGFYAHCSKLFTYKATPHRLKHSHWLG